MMNQSGVPTINDFSDPMLERFMRSQALSQQTEMQLDKAVNRLFDHAGTKKMKLEKMRMERMLTELSHTKNTPSINAQSQRMIRQEPIYMRAGDLAEAKKRKEARRELERKEREDEEFKQLTFKP